MKPTCPKCNGYLKLENIDGKNAVVCIECGRLFQVRTWWPVPGKEIETDYDPGEGREE